jgi:hypothetical protein
MCGHYGMPHLHHGSNRASSLLWQEVNRLQITQIPVTISVTALLLFFRSLHIHSHVQCSLSSPSQDQHRQKQGGL